MFCPHKLQYYFLVTHMFTVVVWIKLKIQRDKDIKKASILQGILTLNNSFKQKEDSFLSHYF